MEISAENLMQGFAELRGDGLLCDITLQTEGKSIAAHRTVLAAASLYFRAMFGGNFKEATENTVDLDKLGISYEGLSCIVDCLYSLMLNITKENCIHVTTAANVLQFTTIMPFCEKFLRNHINMDNCFQLLLMCETLNMEEQTSRKFQAFIRKNFTTIIKRNPPEFVELSKDSLICFISDPHLGTGGEEIEVYRAVMKWIKTSDSRKDHVHELLKHIRIHNISEHAISDELAKEPLLINNEECAKLLQKATDYHAYPYKQPLFETLPPRGEFAMLMCDSTNSSETDSNQVRWSLKALPYSFHEFAETNRCPTVQHDTTCNIPIHKWSTGRMWGLPLKNFIYILYVGRKMSESSLSRYDPASNKWLSLSPVPWEGDTYSKHMIASPLDESLFIGEGHTGSLVSFLYSVEHNTWNRTTDLPQGMYNVVTCNYNNCIYVISSATSLCHLDMQLQMWMLSGKDMVWQKRARPLRIHFNGIFAAVNDKLYIAGGWHSAEMYEVATDQWTYILKLAPMDNMDLLSNINSVLCYVDRTHIFCFGTTIVYDRSDYNEDDSDYEYECHFEDVALIWDTDTGEVTRDPRWKKATGMQEVALVTVPVGRFGFQ